MRKLFVVVALLTAGCTSSRESGEASTPSSEGVTILTTDTLSPDNPLSSTSAENVVQTTSTTNAEDVVQPTSTTTNVATPSEPVESTSTSSFGAPPSGWISDFNELSATTHDVVTEGSSAIAARREDGGWELVVLHTGRTVQVPASDGLSSPDGNVLIGVGAVGENLLTVTDTASVHTLSITEYADDGSPGMAVGGYQYSGGTSASQASVTAYEDSIYILANLVNDEGSSSAIIKLAGGIAMVLTGTIYGDLTFTDDGSLMVTGGIGGQQRTMSTDGGNTWRYLPNVPSAPVVLHSITTDLVIGYMAADPSHVDLYGSDGSVQEIIPPVSAETVGWTTIVDEGEPNVLLVGRTSGVAYAVDLATGDRRSDSVQIFLLRAGEVIVATWTGANGAHEASVADSSCSGECAASTRPFIVISGT